MMRDEVVRRRRWMTDQAFLDLVGATNLIPGPNSTEMAIHIGYARAGWRGVLVAGTCFIIPAMVIVMAFAWAYATYGTVPEAVSLLYGIKPVIIAVVAQALWALGRTAIRGWRSAAVGVAILALFLAGVHELVLRAAGGRARGRRRETMQVWRPRRRRNAIHVWPCVPRPTAPARPPR